MSSPLDELSVAVLMMAGEHYFHLQGEAEDAITHSHIVIVILTLHVRVRAHKRSY